MNVLSLFDGISCGRVALERAGIKIDNYFASEIDKYAIKIAQKNYPDTQQLGDITKLAGVDLTLPTIDLVIGGSPCQGFSFAGKQLNFNDPRSVLFFEFVRILKEVQSDNQEVYFLLENVKMKKEYQDIISEFLGVEPIEINSSLVSAQSRKRLYWTNIPLVKPPKDKGILLKDIVHEYYDGEKSLMRNKACTIRVGGRNSPPGSRQEWDAVYDHAKIKDLDFNVNPSGKGMNGMVYSIERDKSRTITTNKGEGQKIAVDLTHYVVPFDKTLQVLDKEVSEGKVGYFRKDSQANRVYYIHNKAVTLTGASGGGAAKMGQYLFGCITPERVNKRQRGQRFNEGQKFYTLTAQDRHGILIEGYIRKLTPVECERLQTMPEGYTEGVSNTQRYKMLGNGWTVDVVSHIFKNLIL